jgi:thiamine-phosphate pyrophosphorylase
MSGAQLLETAAAVVELAHSAGAVAIVNDRADIARLAGADGVHIGQEDLPPAAVRTIVGETAIVGLSTHTAAQVEHAVVEPVSYVAIGPVFGTRTKATGYDPIGLERVRDAAARARASGLPLVAIGGITLQNARSVSDAGAASVAVVSDLLAGGEPESRVRAFLHALGAPS